MEAQKILIDGCIWRVGDGRSVHIFGGGGICGILIIN